MFRSAACSMLAFLLALPVALSQEIPAEEAEQLKTTWTLEKIENPPPRQVKFRTVETPLPVRLKQIDPALLTQKYGATVQLAIRHVDDEGLPTNLRPVTFWPNNRAGSVQGGSGDYFFFFYRGVSLPSSRYREFPKSLAGTFKLVAEQIPAERRPTEEQLEFFLKTKLEHGYLQIEFKNNFPRAERPSTGDELRTITILAPTAEAAEARAQTLLTLLEWGLVRPVQRAIWEQRAELLKQYPQLVANVTASKVETAKLAQEFAAVKEFTADLRPGVKLQLATTEADIADATARVSECKKLIRETDSPEVRQDIRKLQRTVEIELKGLEARRESLAKYLEQIAAAAQLNRLLSTARIEESVAPSRPSEALKKAIAATRALDNLALRLVDDSVKIQPLKWEP